MSTNFFKVRKFDLQNLEELKFEEKKEEQQQEEKGVQLKPTLTGLKIVTPKERKQFEKWLNGNYDEAFKGIVEDNESTNPFHYETSLTEDDVNNWEALQKAIKEMGLRETYCRGVYCQQHNPEMPAGNYTHQRHFVWNDATQEMVELPEVYYMSSDGREAKGLEGYEEIMAYAQGYKFTETDGVYEKDGKNYRFNVETSTFEEIEEDTRTGLQKLWDKYQTDEYDRDANIEEFLTFIQELNNVLVSEYDYTNEQFNTLLHKALEICPLQNVNHNLSGKLSGTINLKEFATVVRNLIENQEEPEKSSVDKILDKYDTDEYDKDVAGIEAVTVLKEILDELTPVLKTEYNMSDSDIQNLISEAVKACSTPNLTYGSTINIRTFVNTLRELIANFEPAEPENPTVSEIFGDKNELTIHDFYTELEALANSSVQEVSQFANKIKAFFSHLNIWNNYDGEDLVKSVLKIVNNKLGIENISPMILTKDWLNKLIEKDVLSVLDDILNNCMDEVKQEYYCGVDGVIDTFGQGTMGDCWLLSGLISMANNETGKQILKDAIKQNDDGSITVTFKKPATSYTIPAETVIETRESNRYSKGDNDVLAMEIAVSMLTKDIINGKYPDVVWDCSTVENGGNASFLFSILVGQYGSFTTDLSILEDMYQYYKNSTLLVSVGTASNPGVVTTLDGKQIQLVGPHGYGVSNMTENTITLINPWNSSEEFTLTYDEFKKGFNTCFYCDLNSKDELPQIDKNHVISVNGVDYIVNDILNSDEQIFTNFDISSIQYAGEKYYAVNPYEMKDSIKSILDNIISGFNVDNFTDYQKIKKAYEATLFYFNATAEITTRHMEKTWLYASVGYIEVNEHAPMIQSNVPENFDEAEDFGDVENNGILIGYNTDTNRFTIHIDIKAVAEKFLSFLQ